MIGSIDTSEFLVAAAASLGFLVGLGAADIDLGSVAALLLGGMIAAPIAAYLVRLVPPRVLGSAVGGVIIATNGRTLLNSDWLDAPPPVRYGCYALIGLIWAAALTHAIRQQLAERRREPVPGGGEAAQPAG